MFDVKDIVVWVNRKAKKVLVTTHEDGVPPNHLRSRWVDPIGAAYSDWQKMTNKQRVGLMLETAIDLGMNGFALKDVLIAFAEVREFRALGSESYPMARALTSALLGRSLEPNTMNFEELLEHYGKEQNRYWSEQVDV